MHHHLTSLLTEALYLALWLSLPALGIALLVALCGSLVQVFTQATEPVLASIPRSLAVGVTLAIAGTWMGGRLTAFAARILQALPELVR